MCRWGSVAPLGQTLESNVAVIFYTSLRLTAGKPPVLHVKACPTLNDCPQLQWDGKLWSGQPYLRERTSLKAAFGRAKPCFLMGSTVSEVEAPFS